MRKSSPFQLASNAGLVTISDNIYGERAQYQIQVQVLVSCIICIRRLSSEASLLMHLDVSNFKSGYVTVPCTPVLVVRCRYIVCSLHTTGKRYCTSQVQCTVLKCPVPGTTGRLSSSTVLRVLVLE